MSPRRKSNHSNKKRIVVRSKNRQIIVRSVQRPEPDYKKLTLTILELAKDMQKAKDLGVSVETLRRERWSDNEDV